jgi:hypothetical protein
LEAPELGGDLLEPRFVILTNRRWMETYHWMEQQEQRFRQSPRSEHPDALLLWLRCLTLFDGGFAALNAWTPASAESIPAWNIRSELLALAFGTSKLALDALVVGYYSACFGLIRHLLETWKRTVWVRLCPADAMPWYELPEQSPIGEDGMPRRGRKILYGSTVDAGIKSNGSDADTATLSYVNAGIVHMHGGAHPGPEGLVQTWGDKPHQRVIGATYQRRLCMFGLKWGLSANLWLLQELRDLAPHGEWWPTEWQSISRAFGSWLEQYNAEHEIAEERIENQIAE